MKVSELAKLLNNYNEDADIFVEIEGILHDFKTEIRPEAFDGFDTVYEEGINIILTD